MLQILAAAVTIAAVFIFVPELCAKTVFVQSVKGTPLGEPFSAKICVECTGKFVPEKFRFHQFSVFLIFFLRFFRFARERRFVRARLGRISACECCQMLCEFF